MKKNKNQEYERKLNQDLEQYFLSVEVPELNNIKIESLKNHVSENKPIRKRITLWRKITAIASAICLIALIIIPTSVMLGKNDNSQNPTNTPPEPPIYYGKAEATKIPHSLEETQEIINANFSKYNFMFTDLTYVSSMGYYNPTNNNLLAIRLVFNESEIPYSQVEIHLVSSELFVLENEIIYTELAEFTQTKEYKMYKKINPDPFNEFLRGYIIYENHEIYINLARINEALFNKFI